MNDSLLGWIKIFSAWYCFMQYVFKLTSPPTSSLYINKQYGYTIIYVGHRIGDPSSNPEWLDCTNCPLERHTDWSRRKPEFKLAILCFKIDFVSVYCGGVR